MATYAVGSGKAYTTIQSAIDACGAANDVDGLIPVDFGTYTENLNLKKHPSGYCMPVNIYAADSTNRPTIVSAVGSYAILSDVATHAATAGTRQPTFTNIIWSGGSAATYFNYSNGGAPMKFIGCDFVNINLQMFYQPYGGTGATYRWLLDKCYFNNTNQLVFTIAGFGLIRNCRVNWSKNGTTMIQAGDAGWLAYNNSVATTANGGTLFIVGQAKNNAIKVVSSTPTKFFDVVTSYAYNVTSTSLAGTGTNGGGNVVGEPGFISSSAGDFSFATSSACYNAGTTLSDVTGDYLGTARPQATTYDVGAYEYINLVYSGWTTGSGESYVKVTSNFTINRYLNLSGTYTMRSGLNASNGLTTVRQVPFSAGSLGPISLRGRTRAYIVTPEGHNPYTQAGTPPSQSVS